MKRAKKYANDAGIKAKFQRLDIRSQKIKGKYDLILLVQVLHNLQKKERHVAVKKIMEATNEDGINFISFYTERNGKKEFKGLESSSIRKLYGQKGFRELKLLRHNHRLQSGMSSKITTLIERRII